MTKREQTRLDKLELMKLRECVEITELKTKEYKEKPVIFCKEDNKNSYMTIDSFPRHYLKKQFGLTLKEYYDKWYKTKDEENCAVCSKETTFDSNGYRKFCSKTCARKDPTYGDKIKASFVKRDKLKEQEKREKTNIKKYGKKTYSQTKDFNEKRLQTNIERYGESKDFSSKSHREYAAIVLESDKESINKKRSDSWTDEKIKVAGEKRLDTLKTKYGAGIISTSQLVEVKEKILKSLYKSGLAKTRKTNEYLGRWLPLHKHDKFKVYRMEVNKETNKNIKLLYDLWDGTDYYTKELLICNTIFSLTSDKHYNTNRMQPTVDHKTSVKFGFINNIEPSEIGKIENLCVCSKYINSMKSSKTESEFKELLLKEKTI